MATVLDHFVHHDITYSMSVGCLEMAGLFTRMTTFESFITSFMTNDIFMPNQDHKTLRMNFLKHFVTRVRNYDTSIHTDVHMRVEHHIFFDNRLPDVVQSIQVYQQGICLEDADDSKEINLTIDYRIHE